MGGFLDMPYDELEGLNLEAKRARLNSRSQSIRDQAAEAEHRKWLEGQPGVKAVTVCFPDLEGRLHMLDYDKAWLLAHGSSLTFDGSSVRGFSEIGDSDLRLEIDWPAFWRVPADVFGAGKVLVFAFVCGQDGSRYPADFRGRLATLASELAVRSISVRAAMEVEGFLLKGRSAEQGHAASGEFDPVSPCGYFHSLPGDELRRFMDAAARAQRAMGFENEKDHPEVAPSQFELNWSHADMLVAADQTLLYKLVCRQVADRMGLTASFLPKPVAGINGNGMHTNLSVLQLPDRNLFSPETPGAPLSEEGMQFVRRLLARAREMCLILNPSVNSYRRLDPAFEAPNSVRWSACDRSAMVRVPFAASAASSRIEVRSVSPDASPHMLLYSLVKVGLSPGAPAPPPEGQVLCADIHEALESFRADDILGPTEAGKYAALKGAQADRCPRKMGRLVKRGEVMFHHEVTNQSLWGAF